VQIANLRSGLGHLYNGKQGVVIKAEIDSDKYTVRLDPEEDTP
jgi:hypothetical protein